ncbi:MAG: putative bifunctional diguanylate cyclase/phosphodiesterase, partial [Poseidonibacter sp.]|uniref:putative bifunctional diguanylate cyclase/phosphodiesterase n=1 Tax=Poseidonibacter sp. TaxID=2321188 RepID=UPI00359E0788
WLFWMINKSEKDKRILLEYKALHDTLTDLPNRYYLQKNIDKWTNKTNFSLIYFDLDNFKYINDTFGHKFGDEVLKALSNRLRKTINTNDLLIRQGGDEFLIFTNEVSNIEEFCNKLLETFRKPLSVLGSNIIVNGSFGVSNFPKDSQDIDELIVCSDIACYEAKSKRNSYKVFKEEIKNKHIEIMQIEKELKQALEKKELYLVYQPQVNYDNTLYGIETLLRWNNEKLGNVSPEKFIGIAETIGLMPKIGDFIIDTALNQIKTLQDKNKKSFQLSINVSVTQFIEVGFLENLMNKIDKYKIDPSLITLEITESVLIDNLEYMQSLFLQLREKGFTISLDDFGTGYSSLSMLRSVPINELKIDKAFVDDIIDDKTARLLIKTIIEIGNILNYNIVLAEGVESKDQVELLNEFGCRTYQGYFYSKPLEIHRLEQFIQKY